MDISLPLEAPIPLEIPTGDLSQFPDKMREMYDYYKKVRAFHQETKHPDLKTILDVIENIFSKTYGFDNPKVERLVWEETAEAFAFRKNLVKAERVQPFTSEEDLRRRIDGKNRAIYILRIPGVPEAAFISIQVARTYKNSARRIGEILDGTDYQGLIGQPDEATFYSISNWGRAPGPLGEKFILAVAEKIKEEYPHIKNFATLSPIPDFRTWMRESEKFTPEVLAKAAQLASVRNVPDIEKFRSDVLGAANLTELQNQHSQAFKILNHLCAIYLTTGTGGPRGFFRANDQVANFHMRNGAAAGDVLSRADPSPEGFERSFGFMARYEYTVEELRQANADKFKVGEPVVSSSLRRLLGQANRRERLHYAWSVSRDAVVRNTVRGARRLGRAAIMAGTHISRLRPSWRRTHG
jgi:malonyl-CoA decarboxylase